jgi:cyanophycin synthetase
MSNKHTACEDCGNNPAPHILLYAAQTMIFFGSKMPSYFHRKPKNWMTNIVDNLAEKLHIISWSNEIVTGSERTAVIVEAANKAGIELQQQRMFGSLDDTLRYKLNGQWHEFHSLPTLDSDNEATHALLDSKWHTKKLLQELGSSTSNGYVVRTKNQLSKALNNLDYPIVIKPAHGSRGRHSHIFIQNEYQAFEAYRNAKKICAYVMCEKMLDGSIYRFTTVGESLIATLRGEYPSVIGDGKKSIRQLVTDKNKSRPSGVSSIKISKSMNDLVVRQGLSIDSIPKLDQQVLLGQKIGLKYGGDAVEITPEVHESFKAEIERVASILHLFILGFDVIAEDITKAAEKQKWGIIEINTVPFINLHHYPRSGKPVNVAGKIWEEILNSSLPVQE